MRSTIKTSVKTIIVFAIVGMTLGANVDDNFAPTISAKAMRKVVLPGETFEVEITVAHISDLAVVQFKMRTDGGESGALTIEDIVIDKRNPEFAFRTAQVMAAVDRDLDRAGIIQISGGQDIVESAYIATVTLRASEDATGTFQVNLEQGDETFLRDSNAVPIEVAVGDALTVTVSQRARPTKTDRKKRR